MAVILVIITLCLITMGVTTFVQRRLSVATTRAQLAAIASALENYKTDWGYYPRTYTRRLSTDGVVEISNNAVLYRALFSQGKQYLTFPKAQIHLPYYGSGFGGLAQTTTLTNLFDVYGLSFNYYCSPQTPYVLVNINPGGCTTGGQVNVASYDLFSYGRDHITFADKGATAWPPAVGGAPGADNIVWTNYNSTLDDVVYGQ